MWKARSETRSRSDRHMQIGCKSHLGNATNRLTAVCTADDATDHHHHHPQPQPQPPHAKLSPPRDWEGRDTFSTFLPLRNYFKEMWVKYIDFICGATIRDRKNTNTRIHIHVCTYIHSAETQIQIQILMQIQIHSEFSPYAHFITAPHKRWKVKD